MTEGAQRRRHIIDGLVAHDAFDRGRRTALSRLTARGMALDEASEWIGAWDRMTRGMDDFRGKPDFWDVGYEHAVEESARGYKPPPDTTN